MVDDQQTTLQNQPKGNGKAQSFSNQPRVNTSKKFKRKEKMTFFLFNSLKK